VRSGVAGVAARTEQGFRLPERYTDPFENLAKMIYDES
jgi:hypothetical protein